METRAYTSVDKSNWPRGPWDHEPDKLQWQDKATGLPCLIVRSRSGSLCGYVGVPDTHPWHGKDYEQCDNISVHGGLTFADACQPYADESRSICHMPAPGEPDNVWWFGFDCSHCWDLMPAFAALGDEAVYRDLAYVREQCAGLASQLAAVEGFAGYESIPCPFCAKQPERSITTTTCEDCCGSGRLRRLKMDARVLDTSKGWRP